jgi:hypothetical protein
MTSISIKTDLRHLFGPVRDQGQRPTCLAFAASDTHASLRDGWVPLSCEYAFYHAQRRSSRTAAQGSILTDMLGALREDGQPEESAWPYLQTLPADLAKWEPPADVEQLFRRSGEPDVYAIDIVLALLDRGVPALVLLYLSRSFYFAGPNDFIDETAGEGPDFNRRHAVIAVGHGVTNSQRAILIRNSWGNRWGVEGYGWLSEKFLQTRVYKLAVLKEDLSVPRNSVAA